LVPINSSHATSYSLSNFCFRTHRLATIHTIQSDDDRQAQHCSISATISTRSANEPVEFMFRLERKINTLSNPYFLI